ncbi:MAG: asparagine synthase (glutamine-hydrolyzing) [Crocinitomicaceae bacterium]|nr:asparagine synthase (glutamine-hydrolyzing) [Crocinitomicaceae bacterium]
MCGINGIYDLKTIQNPRQIIESMNQSMVHRGPDAQGIYEDENIVLGHRRLSIIDLEEASNQPMTTSEGRYTIVFNGEIYNFQEIKNLLPNYPWKSKGDTEVILAAWQEWGLNAIKQFNGMFAIAIYDKVKNDLHVFRDRLGIKPLYFYYNETFFLFSSSVKSILESGLVPRKLDQDSLIDYLRFQTVQTPKTMVEDVFQLEPGNYIRVHQDGIEKKTYWALEKDYLPVPRNYDTIKEKVRELLTASVERRLISDVEVGAFLSGGIDSSLIVGIIKKELGRDISTFNVNFAEEEFSEAKYARLIADKYQTKHTEINLSPKDFLEKLPEALNKMDHPSGDGPNTYIVSEVTKKQGITVALSGLGGDELFAGYDIFKRIPEVQNKKWLLSFPVYIRKLMAKGLLLKSNSIASRKVGEVIKQPYFDSEYIYQFNRQVFMDFQIEKMTGMHKLPVNSSFALGHEKIGFDTPGWNLPALSKISYLEISTYMQNVLLRDSDQMSMAHSLEIRVPFLDHKLVEYAMGIPDFAKYPHKPKKLLLDAFDDLLPEEVWNRKKMGFVLPYEQWMKNELRGFCESNLNALKEVGHFQNEEIDKLWKQFLNGNKILSWSRIWSLVVLGNWIKENQIEG